MRLMHQKKITVYLDIFFSFSHGIPKSAFIATIASALISPVFMLADFNMRSRSSDASFAACEVTPSEIFEIV